jgi:hypothetical protein
LNGITPANAERKLMKVILIGLCALSVFTGLAPKVAAQNITITVGPTTDDSYWVWNDDYQCWIWTGPEFQGDYLGHPYAYWHVVMKAAEIVITGPVKARATTPFVP